jgi:pyruvate formate lyase activating enzyme
MTDVRDRKEDRGLIFNIQKFSLHDGAGIRTLVFLKGCPLKCTWCSNPEGQAYVPEIAFTETKCIGIRECDMCLKVCESGAIREGGEGRVSIDREWCDGCGKCVDICPARAFERFGRYMKVNDIIRVVEEDSSFYSRSGGGVTIGGGEPLSQPDFAVRLLKAARSRGIHAAIETSGYCDWKDMEKVCRNVDQIFIDIKSMDPDKHRRHTGVGNGRILENFHKLCRTFPGIPTVVRTPVIPGFNDEPEDIQAIVAYLNDISLSVEYELLPYHQFGEPKYYRIGKTYRLSHIAPPAREQMHALKAIADQKKACSRPNPERS